MINFMTKNHYTYAYLREDRTPYYIGRGTGRRAFKSHRHIPVPPKDRILFLKTGLSYAESVKHEIYMVAVLGRKDLGTGILRNLTDGGEGAQNPSLETRQKISEANLGRRLSEETKAKITEAARNMSDETKAKIAEANRNRSPETRAKLSSAGKARRLTPEHRAKIAEVARNASPEVKLRKVASKRGKPLSEETKAKISETKRRNNELRRQGIL
jgi:hypothetical protein